MARGQKFLGGASDGEAAVASEMDVVQNDSCCQPVEDDDDAVIVEPAATVIVGGAAKQHQTTNERAGGKRRPPTPASGGRKKRNKPQKEKDGESREHAGEQQEEGKLAPEAHAHAMDEPDAPQEGLTKRSLTHFTATGVELTAAQRRTIKALGAHFTSEWTPQATHLIADTFRRTTKMMCAICCGARVVVPAYLDACAKAGKLVDDAQFILRDEVCEAAFARKHHLADNFSVSAALERRNQHGPLLHGVSVYCFPSVMERHDLPHLVAAAGGAWLDELPASFPGHADPLLLLAERVARNDDEQEQRKQANRVYDVEMLREAAITQVLRRRQWRMH